MSLEKKLGNRRSLGFKIGTAAIAGLMGIMSYTGCRAEPVEYKPAEEVVETVETEQNIETVQEPEEEKFYKNITLYFEDENNTRFPSNWYEREGLETVPLSEYKIPFTQESVLTTLKKHPDSSLAKYFKAICAFDDITIIENGERVSIGGGTNSHVTAAAYIINKGAENGTLGEGLEEVLQAEMSSILYKNNKDLFDEELWNSINTEKFVYDMKFEMSPVIDPSLFELGFPYKYAMTNLENDYNAYASLLFTNYIQFWDAVKQHERMKQKLNLTAKFYIDVDAGYQSFIKSQYDKYDVEWTLN
jgi:hypothetical protein